jgi:hypothetical protein
VVAVAVALTAALAGCGEWNPWGAQPSASPVDSAAPTAAPTESPSGLPPLEPPPTPTPTSTSTPLGPLSGIWIGEWNNETPISGQGTFTIRWGQQGSDLFGTVAIVGSNCLSSGSITGTVIGTRLRFGAVERPTAGGISIDYTGTVTGPDTLVGTYESDCGPSRGTWTATRTSQDG